MPLENHPGLAGGDDTLPVSKPPSPVLSYNEWDPLEEVILGVADGAAVPPWHPILSVTMPESQLEFFRASGGRSFPSTVIDHARRDLDGLAALLEREGVTVRFPDRIDYTRPFATPDWESPSGLYAAMPRDLLLVVGDEIIEAPMAWRCRYFEINAYRALISEYFRAGARWTAAPKPTLRDEQYCPSATARASSSPSTSRPSTPPTSSAAATTCSDSAATSPTPSASSGCAATSSRRSRSSRSSRRTSTVCTSTPR